MKVTLKNEDLRSQNSGTEWLVLRILCASSLALASDRNKLKNPKIQVVLVAIYISICDFPAKKIFHQWSLLNRKL